MIVVASGNGRIGLGTAIAILQGGGSALDAVEAATRLVEANPDDHTVGLGGYPNLLGVVELDALIMEGRTRRAGAIGALAGFLHPISVARQVLEQLPHVMLVGAGAARFAAEIGAETGELLTDEAARVWREGLEGKVEGVDLTQRGAGLQQSLREAVRLAIDPEHAGGTVNVLARDASGDIAVAVSTSGTAWKYPGRLGDSPVIGAGGYVDNRFGAAACTGLGELAIRAGTARNVVAALARGDSIEAACEAALRDVITLGGDGEHSSINIVALDAAGRPYGASTRATRKIVYQTHDMTEPA
ncbi:MAG: isoaspartyl peptidase/L-asparaginase, partial [Chloroflexales bacterium]|nr:isoaspartyl peptidase/L-asparaginase [Chloroflexales bacterium]